MNSEELRRDRISKSMRQVWKSRDKETRSKILKGLRWWETETGKRDVAGKIRRTFQVRGYKPGPSIGARILRKILGRGWKLEYRVHIPGRSRGHGFVSIDIAHPKLKFAIEVDGTSHSRRWSSKRDRQRDRDLKSLGWVVFRVSEQGCRKVDEL